MGWILSLILSLSLLVRGFGISTAPQELFGDEVDVGYQAYSLLKTGKDLYGQSLPTYIHSLSEWRMPLLMYATVPTIALFGTSEIGVRLPEVLWGSIAPILLFLLVVQTTKSKKLGVLSAFILSITPWHIYYSRSAFEVVIMLDLILLGTLLYLKKKHLLSAIILGLGMYSYSTALVFIPLLIVLISTTQKVKPKIIFVLMFLLLTVPMAFHTLIGSARDRFGLLSVFSSDETTRNINDFRSVDDSNDSIIWHNKIESYTRLLSSNYLRSFSSEFLFVRGDPTYRHSIQVIGQLLPSFAPFLILGIFWLFTQKKYFWILWLVASPLPSIVTNDGGYHATRLFLMLPPLVLAIAAGISSFINMFKTQLLKSSVRTLVLCVISINFIWVGHYYFKHYVPDSWRWWHVGFKNAMLDVAKIQGDYSRVFINNSYEPSLIRYLFYTSYSPSKFQRLFTIDQPQKEIVPGYDGFTIDGKVFFGTFSSSQKILFPGSLYVISQRDDVGGDWDWRTSPPSEVKVLSTSTNSFNQPILYLITKK